MNSCGSLMVQGQVELKVSIVVPTHFRPGMMSRLLEAVKEVEYPRNKLELIVVGAEDDSSRQVVEGFARTASFSVRYQVVAEHALRSVAFKRNDGASTASGDVLAFLDDDCVPHPQWIAAAVSLFGNPAVGGVEGCILVPHPNRPTRTYRGSLQLQVPGGYRTGNIFYRRSVFQECGGFDESLPYLEDTDLGFTVIERGYDIPFASAAAVDHPVQPARPLTGLRLARTARDLPYLFAKHAQSKSRLRENLRLFNRAHFPYLALYGLSVVLALGNPLVGAEMLGGGLCVLVPLHLAHDYWGLDFEASELGLTAIAYPLVPPLRLLWWVLGRCEASLGLRRNRKRASR
jgi:GT2 family glycosyltransferase